MRAIEVTNTKAVRSGSIRVLGFAVLTLGGAISSALAGWSENGREIRTLSELLPSLQAGTGQAIGALAPTDHAVISSEALDLRSIEIDLMLAGLRLDRTGVTPTVVAVHGENERTRAARRLLPAAPRSISPNDPSAIAAGQVAIFGRWVPAPYDLRVEGDQITVNGVAVFPSPGEAIEPITPSAQQVLAHDRMAAAMTLFAGLRGTPAEAQARENLRADLATLPSVTGAAWRNDDELALTQDDGSVEILNFGASREVDPDIASENAIYLNGQAEIFRAALGSGQALLFGATYCIPVLELDGASFAERVRDIRQSSESELLKIARLQTYTSDRNAAADLLYAR